MILTALWIVHFLADFTLQSETMAAKKRTKQRYLLLHSAIYAAALSLTCFVCIRADRAVLPAMILSAAHLIVDEGKLLLFSRRGRERLWVFLADQALHLAVIVLVWRLFRLENAASDVWVAARGWHRFDRLLSCGLIFTLLWDPACVFIRKLFDELAGSARESFAAEPKAGRIIGKLERFLIAVLVLNGELGAIGFVLTAKSLARFKQFEEQGFAERYLVGTLASTALAIAVSLILRTGF